MSRRSKLIKALIHFHQRKSPQRGWWEPKGETLRKLRSKIAERNQYQK